MPGERAIGVGCESSENLGRGDPARGCNGRGSSAPVPAGAALHAGIASDERAVTTGYALTVALVTVSTAGGVTGVTKRFSYQVRKTTVTAPKTSPTSAAHMSFSPDWRYMSHALAPSVNVSRFISPKNTPAPMNHEGTRSNPGTFSALMTKMTTTNTAR